MVNPSNRLNESEISDNQLFSREKGATKCMHNAYVISNVE